MARRTLAAALAAVAALITATAAYAHAGDPNYESVVRTVSPSIPGFTADVLNGDDRLEVANRGTSIVTIEGYDSEPYLRLSPDGTVAVNRRSPAYFLNQDRLGGATVPPSADGKAPPSWKVVARTGRYEFHDHRMHWMGTATPEQVSDESARTKIFDWNVPIRTPTGPSAIEGQLFWRGSSGGPPAGAFAGLALVALLGGAAVVVVRRRRGATDGDRPAGPTTHEEAW
jgi:hypothetical protein